jgi:hypothetical protein
VLDQVALRPADNGEAVLGEGGKLGAPEAVPELAGVRGDLGHHAEHGSYGAGRDTRLGRQVKGVHAGRKGGRHDDTPKVWPGMTARRFHGTMETLRW